MINNDSAKLGTSSMSRVRIPPSAGRREIASIMLSDGKDVSLGTAQRYEPDFPRLKHEMSLDTAGGNQFMILCSLLPCLVLHRSCTTV